MAPTFRRRFITRSTVFPENRPLNFQRIEVFGMERILFVMFLWQTRRWWNRSSAKHESAQETESVSLGGFSVASCSNFPHPDGNRPKSSCGYLSIRHPERC